MNTGIIFHHFWNKQKHKLELACHENTKNLITILPKHISVLAFDVDKKTIRSLITSRFTDLENLCDQKDMSIEILKSWIKNKNISSIFIAGLHFNSCVMKLATDLKNISDALDKDWNNDFKVKVIEECTISLSKDEETPCRLEETNLYMTYDLVRPWLINRDQVLEKIKQSHALRQD